MEVENKVLALQKKKMEQIKRMCRENKSIKKQSDPYKREVYGGDYMCLHGDCTSYNICFACGNCKRKHCGFGGAMCQTSYKESAYSTLHPSTGPCSKKMHHPLLGVTIDGAHFCNDCIGDHLYCTVHPNRTVYYSYGCEGCHSEFGDGHINVKVSEVTWK